MVVGSNLGHHALLSGLIREEELTFWGKNGINAALINLRDQQRVSWC
jgi:hypothetical protein